MGSRLALLEYCISTKVLQGQKYHIFFLQIRLFSCQIILQSFPVAVTTRIQFLGRLRFINDSCKPLSVLTVFMISSCNLMLTQHSCSYSFRWHHSLSVTLSLPCSFLSTYISHSKLFCFTQSSPCYINHKHRHVSLPLFVYLSSFVCLSNTRSYSCSLFLHTDSFNGGSVQALAGFHNLVDINCSQSFKSAFTFSSFYILNNIPPQLMGRKSFCCCCR